MKSPIKILQNKPVLNLYWMLTDFCNFKCNYCPDFLHSGKFATGSKPGFPSDDDLRTFVKKIKAKTENIHINLQFGGGEPTLHPMFPELVRELKNDKNEVGVTTNGSRSAEWWREILPLDNITISLHPEFTKINKVNELSRVIIDSGTNLRFNLSCDPNNWDETIRLFNNLDDEFKQFVQPKVLNFLGTKEKNNYKYEPHQEEWIRDHSVVVEGSDKFINSSIIFDDDSVDQLHLPTVTINEWNKFKGWQCKVNSQSLKVDFTGRVFAGICNAKLLGTLTNFSIDDDFLICPFENCVCPNDLRSEKHKIVS